MTVRDSLAARSNDEKSTLTFSASEKTTGRACAIVKPVFQQETSIQYPECKIGGLRKTLRPGIGNVLEHTLKSFWLVPQ